MLHEFLLLLFIVFRGLKNTFKKIELQLALQTGTVSVALKFCMPYFFHLLHRQLIGARASENEKFTCLAGKSTPPRRLDSTLLEP